MKRPLGKRVWFYRPGQFNLGFRFIQMGSDEFDWHTLMIGSVLTGVVVIALWPCPQTGMCEDEPNEAEWPVDLWGHNHTDPNCKCESCIDNMFLEVTRDFL